MKFAHLIAAELRGASVAPMEKDFIGIVGRLDVGSVIADIAVAVPERFDDLKKKPPLVFCSEPWVKKGAEWHNLGSLCWVIPNEWEDVMNWKDKPVTDIMTEGVAWFLNGVRSLLSRHYYAHLAGIETWPAEWIAWAHGEAGVREYKQERRNQR